MLPDPDEPDPVVTPLLLVSGAPPLRVAPDAPGLGGQGTVGDDEPGPQGAGPGLAPVFAAPPSDPSLLVEEPLVAAAPGAAVPVVLGLVVGAVPLLCAKATPTLAISAMVAVVIRSCFLTIDLHIP